MWIVFFLDGLDWHRVLDFELVDGSLDLVFVVISSNGTRYLLIELCLGGGSGGGGGWCLLLPDEILGKLGVGFIVMLVLIHFFTPVLNFSSLCSLLRLSSNLLKMLALL